MAKQVRYRQCVFQKASDRGGHIKTIGWVPEVHKGVKIREGVSVTLDDDPEWWDVLMVTDVTISRELAMKQAHAWTKYREQTDI